MKTDINSRGGGCRVVSQGRFFSPLVVTVANESPPLPPPVFVDIVNGFIFPMYCASKGSFVLGPDTRIKAIVCNCVQLCCRGSRSRHKLSRLFFFFFFLARSVHGKMIM